MPKTAAQLTALTFLTLANACVVDMGDVDPETGFLPEAQDEEQVIVGGVNWVEVTALESDSPERINSHAVGYISIPAKGTRCTGFLINDDVVMTNEHCISSASQASGARVSFRREAGVPWSEWASYDCSEFLGDSSSLDFALLRCEGSPGQTHGVVELEARNAQSGEGIYVIQQNCDYYSTPGCSPTKKYAAGQVTRLDSEVQHNADTLGGSSGSPVFSSSSHKVFALHHVGVGNNGNGRGWHNYAVPMSSILIRLEDAFPSVQLGGGSAQPSPAPTLDAFEPNNSGSEAPVVALPFTEGELGITQDDVDVFAVELNEDGDLYVALDFAHDAGDLDVTLHQGGTQNPAVARADSADDDEVLAAQGLSAGTYLVVVYGYNGAQNDYGIDVSFDPAAEGTPPADDEPAEDPVGDEPADDGTLEGATAIDLPFSGDDAIEDADDEDFYVFTTAGGSVDVDLSFSHGAGDLDLYLLDAAGEQVDSSLSVSDVEQVGGNLAAGTYYVRVIGYGGATGSYSLQVQ